MRQVYNMSGHTQQVYNTSGRKEQVYNALIQSDLKKYFRVFITRQILTLGYLVHTLFGTEKKIISSSTDTFKALFITRFINKFIMRRDAHSRFVTRQKPLSRFITRQNMQQIHYTS